ncbi:protein Wnt-6-like isoform X2 [Ornithodoros turicata]|uniref:protein Wnt-6-like isoform X2 n=1 Tax=Ornithodoros turicata TaxID=34597 RepID=UPI0031393832
MPPPSCSLLLLLLVAAVTVTATAFRWRLVTEPGRICRKRWDRRTGGQARFCRKEPKVVKEISRGVHLALRECQSQLRHERWNCTTVKSSMRRLLMRDTRESGLVDAFVAAGVVYALAEACAQGRLVDCRCRRQRLHLNPSSRRSCETFVDFGYHKSRTFLGRPRAGGDFRARILAHNYEAGRNAVRQNLERVCRCHGMSGTCSLRTCWLRLPQFSKVGRRLRGQLENAVRVSAGNTGKGFALQGPTPTRQDIVYSETSPDFCEGDRRSGSLGTRGRLCERESSGPEGCQNLCCGRGQETRHMLISTACNCTFQYCCKVTCQTCWDTVERSTCS